MVKNILSTDRYCGIRVESIHRSQLAHQNSKVCFNTSSKVSINRMSKKPPTSLITSKIKNSVAENNDHTFSTTVTSFQQSRTISQEEILPSSRATKQSEILHQSNTSTSNSKYKQLKEVKQFKRYDTKNKYIFKILYGILSILLLSALIIPSIFVYLLTPKSSQTELSQLSAYRNHCSGVSPRTLWQINTSLIITMILNTSSCDFQETPLYFLSISGTSNHYCLTGYGAIYFPTEQSFQIYAQSTCGGWSSSSMLSYAASYGWDVNWIGFYKENFT